jgi:hypothetical protein
VGIRTAGGGRGGAVSATAELSAIQLQYLEDSYATAASFRKDGSWTVQTKPGGEPFQV